MEGNKSKPKNKKLLTSIVLVVVVGLVLAFVFMRSSGIEKQIVGSWTSVDGEQCDTTMSEIITFRKDNMIEGIEGFKEYRIEKTDHDDFDYAVLSGHYEDATRYRVNIKEDDTLQIVYEEDDIYDFNSAISCHMNKK